MGSNPTASVYGKCMPSELFVSAALHLHKTIADQKFAQNIGEHFEKMPLVKGAALMKTHSEQLNIRIKEKQRSERDRDRRVRRV